MATPREQFLALRKSGVNPIEARKQVISAVAPAQAPQANIPTGATMPIAPQVAHAPTPVPPAKKGITTPSGATLTPEMEAQLKGPLSAQDQATIDRMTAEGRFGDGTKPPKAGSFNEQTQGMNVDQRRAVRAGVVPPATEGTTTPSGATLTPEGTIVQPGETKAPTAEVTTPKAEVTKDFNVSTGREAEIQKNVTDITKSNPALLKDRQAYDKAFGYATADEGKKAILDSNFKGGQPVEMDTNTIFSTLRSGGNVPAQNTQAYRTAQARFNTFKKFSTFDVASLSTALSGGDLLVGTQAYNDLVSDPVMKAKIDKAQIYTSGTINMEEIGTKQGAYVMSNSPTVANAMADGSMSQDEYNQLTNNEEVSAQAIIMGEKKTEYETMKAQYDAVEDDINKEYEGKDVTDSFKAKLTADRRKGMYKSLTIATIEYQNAMGTYTELKNNSTQLLEINMKAYEQQKAEQAQIASEQRAMTNSLALSQMQFEQKLDQQAQLASDPVTGVQNIVDTFSKMGIYADRSTQEMVQEVQSKMAQGMTVGEALSDLQKAFKSKPEYQKQMSLAMGQMSDVEKMNAQYQQQVAMQDRTFSQQLAMNDMNFNQDIQKMSLQYDMNDAQGRTDFRRDLIGKGMSETQADAIVRNETGEWNGVTGEKLLYAEDGTFIKSTLPQTTNPNGGIECAEYISKMVGSKVGSTWEEKQALNKETTGGIGSIAVWQPVKSGPLAKYGHAGIIVGEDANNWYIKSANYNVDGKISTDAIPKSEVKNFRSTKLSEKMTQGANEPLTDKQFTQSNQVITSFKSDPTVKAFEEAYSQGMSLVSSLNDKTGPGDVAAIFQFMKTLDPASVVRESEFELAAKSAGVGEYLGNTWERVMNGKKLSDKQAEAFGKLAKQFIIDKSKIYDTKYQDGIRRLEKQGIDTSVFPESTAEQMRQSLGVSEKQKPPMSLTDLKTELSSIFQK